MAQKADLEMGSLVDIVMLITDAQLLTDRRGQNYYNLTANLEGGNSVDAKVWADNITDKLECGQAIETLARVEEYRGEMQLNLQRYSILPEDSFDPSPYVKTTDINVDEAYETMFNWAEADNPLLRQLMGHFHENESFADKFKTAPAARTQHHNYRGGLIEHTLEVWKLADALAGNYGPGIDRETLLAGAALHDIGKVRCYSLVSGVSEHTEDGQLVEHIFIGTSMVSNLWDSRIDYEDGGVKNQDAHRQKSLLLHLLLSHHGKKEWGAPVLPKTPEAVLLHFCDQISATMRSCYDAIDNSTPDDDWSEWVTVMDEGRKLFCKS